MTQSTAQNIRRAGLFIEVICMFGLLRVWRRNPQLPNPDDVMFARGLMIGLGLGFATWVVGTMLNIKAGRSTKSASKPESQDWD